jgi:hypothetical protein
MSKPNLKSQAKRKRELAKLGKRQAKDQKRALRKAERAGSPVATSSPVNPSPPTGAKTPLAGAPLSLAEAARRWAESKAPTTKPRR